jgi:hypothetical protein
VQCWNRQDSGGVDVTNEKPATDTDWVLIACRGIREGGLVSIGQ